LIRRRHRCRQQRQPLIRRRHRCRRSILRRPPHRHRLPHRHRPRRPTPTPTVMPTEPVETENGQPDGGGCGS
jgi:hypothetical protein